MNLKEYNKLTHETAVYPREVNNFGLAYCFLGLIDEINEFVDVLWEESPKVLSIVKEGGDAFWYLSETCNQYTQLNFPQIVESAKELAESEDFYSNESSAGSGLETIAGDIKKFYRDNKPLDTMKVTAALVYEFAGIIAIFNEYGISLEEVLETNYLKLKKRRETNTIHGDGDYREEKA